MGKHGALAAMLVLVWVGPAHADVMGIRPCVPGGHPVRNPHHGMGWCEASPCETDTDCAAISASSTGAGGPATPLCRVVGVCSWTSSPVRTDAIDACITDGAPCGGPVYSDGGVCRVRGHCVTTEEASGLPRPGDAPPAAPTVEPPPTAAPPPPTSAPIAAPAPSPAPAAESSWGCRATTARSRSSGIAVLLGLALAAQRRRLRGRSM